MFRKDQSRRAPKPRAEAEKAFSWDAFLSIYLPALVLAHGVLMDREMFAPQVDALRSRYRVITWDARCHGETETTDDPFSYADLAEDLKGLLDHLGIAHAVIGGMSQGGFVALRFALKHPEGVDALILLSTQAGAEDPDKAGLYESMLEVWEADRLNDQLAETIAAILLGNEWPGREAWIVKWRQRPRSLPRAVPSRPRCPRASSASTSPRATACTPARSRSSSRR